MNFMVGYKINNITILEHTIITSNSVRKDNRERPAYRCRCHCGKEFTIRRDNLNSGNVRSCGCSKASDVISRTLGNKYKIKTYREPSYAHTVNYSDEKKKQDIDNMLRRR